MPDYSFQRPDEGFPENKKGERNELVQETGLQNKGKHK